MNAKYSIPVVVAALLVSVTVSNPVQGEPAAAPSRVVNLKDLDLSRSTDVRTLYGRIGNAAWRVCSDLAPMGNGPSGIENGKCRRALVEAAVAEVNHPALTAYHAKTPAPVTASR
jgi:UrcA family protein